MNTYYMVSIIGRKEMSKNMAVQILWHNCYKHVSGTDTKKSILGQAVMDFTNDHEGAAVSMFLINPVDINKGE